MVLEERRAVFVADAWIQEQSLEGSIQTRERRGALEIPRRKDKKIERDNVEVSLFLDRATLPLGNYCWCELSTNQSTLFGSCD